MSVLRWLHISDLHYGYPSFDTIDMQAKMMTLPDILNEKNVKPEYLFITGDLRHGEAEKKEFPHEIEKQIKLLMQTLDIKPQNVQIVMGNHDVIQSSEQKISAIQLRESYKTNGIIDCDILSTLTSSYNPFYEVYEKICERPHPKSHHYFVQEKDFNIICINTALARSHNDHGQLIIGMELLKEALRGIDKNKPGIVLAHHSFDSLQNEEQEKLKILLKDSGALVYLCGDAHTINAENIDIQRQDQPLWVYVCGTNSDKRGGSDSYADRGLFIGELNTVKKQGYVQALEYSRRSGWLDCREFSLPYTGLADGKRYFPIDKRKTAEKITVDSQYGERVYSVVENKGVCPKCGAHLKGLTGHPDFLKKFVGFWLFILYCSDNRKYSLFHFYRSDKTSNYVFEGIDYDENNNQVYLCKSDDIRTSKTKDDLLYMGSVNRGIYKYDNIGAFSLKPNKDSGFGCFTNINPNDQNTGWFDAYKLSKEEIYDSINTLQVEGQNYDILAKMAYEKRKKR